jgi:hypothetical protein
MEVRELRPGLWRWTAPHPDWKPADGGPDGWERGVGCVYFEAGEAVVLIDPLVPPEPDREHFLESLDADVERAGLPVAVLLTVDWHARSASELVARYGASLGTVPAGVEQIPVAGAGGEEERVTWLAKPRALVTGDVILGTGGGGVRVCPDSWLPEESRGPAIRERLSDLLDLPIELLLVSHGEPVLADGREALLQALSPSAA